MTNKDNLKNSTSINGNENSVFQNAMFKESQINIKSSTIEPEGKNKKRLYAAYFLNENVFKNFNAVENKVLKLIGSPSIGDQAVIDYAKKLESSVEEFKKLDIQLTEVKKLRQEFGQNESIYKVIDELIDFSKNRLSHENIDFFYRKKVEVDQLCIKQREYDKKESLVIGITYALSTIGFSFYYVPKYGFLKGIAISAFAIIYWMYYGFYYVIYELVWLQLLKDLF